MSGTPLLRVLSLGAGVQSTTLALMAAHGEIEAPDCAIFADTGWEPAEVYEHLDRIEPLLPFPVHRVNAGDIRDSIATGRYEPIPWHVPGGMGRRQCTKQYKIYPIRRKVRELLGGKTPRDGCEMWIGISRDEAHRMKPASVAYIHNRWPLIERDMTRQECRRKLASFGTTAPRSACCGCPFLSDADWRLRRHQPEWAATVALSHRLAATGQYMHRSLKPLDQVDLSTAAERGQGDLFGNECEGVCGV
jgi:3''-phosphoadenosine 5''-phosphosulfate sulfotransferase (PAPS reductase)/FAD synthetase and related enzymes